MGTKRKILLIGYISFIFLFISSIYLFQSRFDHLIYFYSFFSQGPEKEGLVLYLDKIKENVPKKDYVRLLNWMIRQVNNNDIFEVAYTEIKVNDIKELLVEAEYFKKVIDLKPTKSIIMEYL